MPKHQARTAHSNTNRPGMTASLMSYVQVVAARKGGISSGDLVSTNRDPTARIVREAVLVALSDAGYTAENVACYFPCDKSTIYGAKKRWNANGGRTQLHISVYVATGHGFHGREVKQGPVIFVAGEGHNGLSRRFAAWSRHQGVKLDGCPLFLSQRAAQFLDKSSAAEVAAAVDEIATEHGTPRLIVVDTLARNFGAGDENGTQDMSAFVTVTSQLRERYPGSTVLIIHHTGHADKQRGRGAMALKAALDTEYRIEKSEKTVSIHCTKMKDAAEPESIYFALSEVELGIDTKGNPYGSAVLVPAASVKGAGSMSANQRIGLQALTAALQEHARETDILPTVTLPQWREEFYRLHPGENQDTKRRAFNRVRKDLVDSGGVIVTGSKDGDAEKDLYGLGWQ